jgi:protein TonB
MSKLKLQSLITAIAVYIAILVAIFFAIFFKEDIPKSKVYTAKKSDIIEVSLGSPNSGIKKKKSNKKSKKKSNKKKKPKPKKIRNNKTKTKPKKPPKVKKSTTKKSTKKTKPKKYTKPNTDKLFGSIGNDIKKGDNKQKGKNGKSLAKENKSKGIVNKYMANIQNTLQGWPAQSNFAGEKIRVELTVYSSGLFDYKILSRSLNPEFNSALKSYLEQLKKFGFGPHSNPKPLKIIVEFIAKE